MRILNTYDLSGDYGIGYGSTGGEFYFDLEDYDKIKDYTWRLNEDNYVVSNPFGKITLMHNLIMKPPSGKEVDHIFHNTNDNRKEYLRICETYENAINKRLQSNNTSGVKGVSWNNSRSKWVAYINYNKKRISLGRFDSFKEAVKVREEAEKQYHKEFICDL